MNNSRHCEDHEAFLELKSELTTTVQILGILHDFIESIFGERLKSFYDLQQSNQDAGRASNAEEAFRALRWKYINSPKAGGNRASIVPELKRPSNETETERLQPNRSSMVEQDPSEVIDVKLEVNCGGEEILPDFLEDVDTFSGEPAGSSFEYEGESSAMHISSSFELSSNHYDSQLHCHRASNAEGVSVSAKVNASASSQSPSHQQSRFIPGLIPIQSETDPLKNEENFSEQSMSSDSSDGDWQPTSTNKKVKREALVKTKTRKITAAAQKLPTAQKRSAGSAILQLGKTNITPTIPIIALSDLRRHQAHQNQNHGEGGPYKCSMCPASYKQEESLKSHQKYKHNPSRVQCQCPLCGKSMVDKYRLQRHLRLHTGEKPFECQYCGQSFYRKDYHTKHMQRKHGLSSASYSHSPSSTSSNSNSSASTGKTSKKLPSTTISSARNVNTALTVSSPRVKSGPEIQTTPPITVRSHQSTPSSSNLSVNHDITSSSGTSASAPPGSGFIDYFSSLGGSSSDHTAANLAISNSLGIGSTSLMTMTSLTFDDLISADL